MGVSLAAAEALRGATALPRRRRDDALETVAFALQAAAPAFVCFVCFTCTAVGIRGTVLAATADERAAIYFWRRRGVLAAAGRARAR